MQGFQDTWWFGLLDTLKEAETGVFYVFFDGNQRIFTQIINIPMGNAPLYLDEISAIHSTFKSDSNLMHAMRTFNVLIRRVIQWKSFQRWIRMLNVVSCSRSYGGWSAMRVFHPSISSSSCQLAKSVANGN
jgi:hypothetical protein